MASGQRNMAVYSLALLTISVCPVIFCDAADAQVDKNTLESVYANQTRSASNEVAQINMVGSPGYLFDASTYNKVYVTNSLNDKDKNGTVSVIDTVNDVVVRNIPVGAYPKYIYGDLSASPLIYVANWGSQYALVNGTVSVIDTRIDSVIENISVGANPEYIYGDLTASPLIYVVNSGAPTINNVTEDAINVIDTSNNNAIIRNISIASNPKNISISVYPSFIFVDPLSELVYVAENNYSENNDVNGTVSVLGAKNDTLLKSIPVGKNPRFIFKSPESRDIYVANSGSNTVSVIDGKTYEVTHIPVEDSPVKIYGQFASKDSIHSEWMDYIYVTYSYLNRISVISTWDNNVIQNLPAESNRRENDSPPPYIHLAQFGYFTNYGSNTTSVFDRMNSTVIKNITVGVCPVHINGGRFGSDAIYVANSISSGVSLINSVTNEVVSRVTFDIIPSTVGQARPGDIICNAIEAPLNQFFYISSGSRCIAKPSNGFEFASWIENLDGNLTRTIASASGSPWTAFLDTINIKQDDPTATLSVDRLVSLRHTLEPFLLLFHQNIGLHCLVSLLPH
jgi:YVTN family beta-propeller protein